MKIFGHADHEMIVYRFNGSGYHTKTEKHFCLGWDLHKKNHGRLCSWHASTKVRSISFQAEYTDTCIRVLTSFLDVKPFDSARDLRHF